MIKNKDGAAYGKPVGKYGECIWIGGIAFHYGQGEASQEFAAVGIEAMPELAQKKAKEREKRARKRANQKKRKDEAKLAAAAEAEEEEEAAAAERRKELKDNPVSLADLLEQAELIEDDELFE